VIVVVHGLCLGQHFNAYLHGGIVIKYGLAFVSAALFLCGVHAHAKEAVPGNTMGATTCGQSTCHSANIPWPNSAVAQNEFTQWQIKDPHSGSYKTLTSKKARRIARFTSQGDPTQSAKCLGCHAFQVPKIRQEQSYDITEGVTCEACHGPASGWLGVHTAGLYFYSKNVEKGMYPTTDPTARAKLCLSCHVGDGDKFVSHSMMAAGHPVLPFELGFYSWFTKSNPGDRAGYVHFKVDDDYLQRKPWPFGVKVWAIGQVAQAKAILELVTDPKNSPRGLFPELALFECQSCHQSAKGSGAYGPTLPKIKAANLLFSEFAAKIVDDRLAARLRSNIRSLRASPGISWGAVIGSSRRLKKTLGEIEIALESHNFTIDDNTETLARITKAYMRGRLHGYESSEQAVLAVGSLVDELDRLETLSVPLAAEAISATQRGLMAFKNQDVYSRTTVHSTMRDIAQIIAQHTAK